MILSLGGSPKSPGVRDTRRHNNRRTTERSVRRRERRRDPKLRSGTPAQKGREASAKRTTEANGKGRHVVLNNTPLRESAVTCVACRFTSFHLRWATQIRALFDLRPRRDGLSHEYPSPLRCGTSTGRRSKGAERSVCSFEVEGAGYLPTWPRVLNGQVITS